MALEQTVTGIQNGDAITPVYASTGAPAAAAAGLYDITVTPNATPAVLGNYAITLNIGTLTVGGNTLIVTAADKTKVYGDVFTTFTGTVVGLQPGDVITATYASPGAAANAVVGDHNITVTLNDPGNKLPNYTVIINTGTLTVTPRALTVTPDNKAKVFGTVFNAFTGTVTGVQAGDNITPVISDQVRGRAPLRADHRAGRPDVLRACGRALPRSRGRLRETARDPGPGARAVLELPAAGERVVSGAQNELLELGSRHFQDLQASMQSMLEQARKLGSVEAFQAEAAAEPRSRAMRKAA